MKTVRQTLLIFLGIGLIIWPVNSAWGATTNCNSIVNPTYKSQCLANKAKADAAAVAAAAAAQQAQQVQAQISTINDSISKINDSISTTAGQITDTQAKIDDLSAQIKKAEDDIAAQKVKMGQIIAAWYMQGDSGLLESLLGSNTISEVIDMQEQYDSVKQQVNADIDKITADQQALTSQKNDQLTRQQQLADLQAQQKSSKSAAVSESQRKNNLLNMTLAQQQQYLDAAKKALQEVSRISAEEAAWRAAQDAKSHANISTGGTGGYPYGNSDALDPWLFYQLQCTSYVAWYWNNSGRSWYNTQPGRGDAKYWNEIAATLGHSTGSTPQVGAIISWQNIGSHGHVAIVQAINGDGSINVSEYNWIAYSYSYRSNVIPSVYGSYVYIY